MTNKWKSVSIEDPVLILQSTDGDSADHYLILYRKELKPLIIAIENKSQKIKNIESTTNKIDMRNTAKNLPNLGKQFNQTRDCFGRIKDLDINHDFLYIYFDTSYSHTNFFCVNGALSLTEKESKKFFGPLFDMYRTSRNNIELVDLLNKKLKMKSCPVNRNLTISTKK